MNVVFRALVRAQTRALAYDKLGLVAGELFRGSEAKPPAFLLKLPGGGAFAAEIADVVEIEQELGRLASDERIKFAKLMASAVLADPRDVDLTPRPIPPHVPASPGETVEPNPGFRPLR
jgi:hypothetical protein